jgi:rod shape-determining protein MreD
VQTFRIVLTIAATILLQVLLSEFGFVKYVDLPLVVTAYFSFQRQPLLAMFTGMILGLGGDAIGGGVLGVGGFSKTLIGYLISVTSIRLSLENPLARLATVAVASTLNTILYAGLYLMIEQPLPNTASWPEVGKMLGWKLLADTLATLPVLITLDRVFAEQTAARRMAIKKRFYE